MAAGPLQSRWLTSRPLLMQEDEGGEQERDDGNKVPSLGKKCRFEPIAESVHEPAKGEPEVQEPPPLSSSDEDDDGTCRAFRPSRRRQIPVLSDLPLSATPTDSGSCDGNRKDSSRLSACLDQEEIQSLVGEKDYLEFRAVTSHIKHTLIEALGGDDPDDQKRIASQITRGRCSFTSSVNPPRKVTEDNPMLKGYQVAAIHWLLTLFANGLNGLVADDMGLGKSAECICFLKRLYADNLLVLPTVVACPATLLDNWCFEFKKWGPQIRVLKYHGTQNERKGLMRKFETGQEETESEEDEDAAVEEEPDTTMSEAASDETDHPLGDSPPSVVEENTEEVENYPLPKNVAYHVLVTTHQTLANRFDRQLFFKLHNFGFLVVDEAHSLKNSASLRYQQMNKNVNAPNRLLLTGSPVQNQISELKNLLTFLNPYRKFPFNINDALNYHTAVWKRAVDRGKKRKEKNPLHALSPHSSSSPPSPESSSSPSAKEDEDEKREPPLIKPVTTTQNLAEIRISGSSAPVASSSTATEKQQTDPEVLFYQQLLAPLILRRLKTEVIDNFPRKTNIIQLCDMLPVQKRLYEAEIRAAKPLLSGLKAHTNKNGVTTISKKRAKRSSKDSNIEEPVEQNPAAESRTTASDMLSLLPVDVVGLSTGTSSALESPSAFIKGLLFRLRRICNHPLLYQYYYSKANRMEFAQYFKSNLPEFEQFPIAKILQHVHDLSDFDLHMVACSHQPDLARFKIPPDQFLQSCKVKTMLELIDEVCLAKHEKVLIFSQYTSFLDVIGEVLSVHRPEIRFLRLDGSTKVYERSSMVSAFQSKESEFKIFLLSTKAGGVGLNLTSANTVLLMDQDWNPHNDRQAEDRVHRLGQTADVTVYRLCCRHSFEESVLSCCKKKLELDEAFGGTAEALPLEIFEDIIRTVNIINEDEKDKEVASEESSTVAEKSTDKPSPITTEEVINDDEDQTKPTTNLTAKDESAGDVDASTGSRGVKFQTPSEKKRQNAQKSSGSSSSSSKRKLSGANSNESAAKKRVTNSGHVNSSASITTSGKVPPAAQRLGVTSSTWGSLAASATADSSKRSRGSKKKLSGAGNGGTQMLLPGCESDEDNGDKENAK